MQYTALGLELRIILNVDYFPYLYYYIDYFFMLGLHNVRKLWKIHIKSPWSPRWCLQMSDQRYWIYITFLITLITHKKLKTDKSKFWEFEKLEIKSVLSFFMIYGLNDELLIKILLPCRSHFSFIKISWLWSQRDCHIKSFLSMFSYDFHQEKDIFIMAGNHGNTKGFF